MLVEYSLRNLWSGLYVVLSEVVSCTENNCVDTERGMIRQGGQDVVNWILQTVISDKKYRYVDLWDIESCHLVRIGEYHLKKTPVVVVSP